MHKGILLGALLVFILGIGATFCYLVIYKPRNLYAPTEIPETAIGKSLYLNDESATTRAALAKIAVREQDKEPESPSVEVLKAVINNVEEHLCWFLLKVADKEMGIGDEFRETIIKEVGLYDYADTFNPTDSAFGYFVGLLNFRPLLLDYDLDSEQNTITFTLSPEALDLIWQRLHPETATSS